jgi:hypothetical protein
VTGPHDDQLPPGRLRRGQYLLTGRIKPADAHPLELAYATAHVLTHLNLDVDTFHRPRDEVALAELRTSFGDWPRARFGEAVLRALVATGTDQCLRCRANAIATAYGLHRPGWDEATVYLIGRGCQRCRPRNATSPRAATAGGGARPSPPVRPTRNLAAMVEAVPPGASARVYQLLLDLAFRDDPYLNRPAPSILDRPVHPALRR